MDTVEITLQGHLIRSYDVMILGIVYLVFGLASSFLINKFSLPMQPGDSKIKIVIEILLEVAVTVLFAYIIHQIVEKMPLPMAGTTEIKQQIIREVRGGIVIAFSMFVLQVKLRNKIQLLFFGKIEN